MSTPIDLRAKVDDYLAERRRLGFELRNMALALASFASYAEQVGSPRPINYRCYGRLGPAGQSAEPLSGNLGSTAQGATTLHPLASTIRATH